MSANSEFREYENGVADVLASVVGEAGTVQRNVKLPSRSGGRARQIDVLVETTASGVTNTRVIVDCKRWKAPIDVKDVEAFIGLLVDVGADLGILVSAAGASDGAMSRAEAERGLRIKALSVAELERWRPAGTIFGTFEIPQSSLEKVMKALREAGLRVLVRDTDDEKVRIEVFRHYGAGRPNGSSHYSLIEATLDKLNVPYRALGNGIVADGGTPNHRWIPTFVNGTPFVKVLAATEAELQNQLDILTRQTGVPVELIMVERPDGWPYANIFPF